jgi:hypothetical protein
MNDYMNNRRMRYDSTDYDMNRGGRDGRNPYGSRGGYVTNRRPRRDRAYNDRGYYEGTFRGNSDRTSYDQRYNDMRDMGSDYGDYAAQRVLTPAELNEWKMDLMEMLNDSAKGMFSEDIILNKARQMGMQLTDYTEEELVVTTLMLYTDYCNVCGKANPEKYIKMADAFLMDQDAAVFGGEKLAMYHDCIVKGDV